MNYLTETEIPSGIFPGLKYKIKRPSHGRRMALNVTVADARRRITALQQELTTVQDSIDTAEEISKQQPCECAHPPEEHDKETGQCVHGMLKADFLIRARGEYRCPCRRPIPDKQLGGYPRRRDLITQTNRIVIEEIFPVYIRQFFVSAQIVTDGKAEAFEINGATVTADLLLSEAPSGEGAGDSLVEELGSAIQDMLQLSTGQNLGFESPTTSGAAVEATTGTENPTNGTSAPVASEIPTTAIASAASTTPS